MASIIAQVDRTVGNYEQVFIYTLNASFSGVEGDINSAEIRMFFPDFLNIYLGDYRDPVKNVTENQLPDGKEIIYNFGEITDLGVAVRLGFGAEFMLDAENLSTFTLKPKLFINGIETISTQSAEIKLEVIPNFELRRQVILPNVDPSPGSEIYYKTTLQNFGDLGAKISSISIVCGGAEGLTIDKNFEIRGFDKSTKFEDKSADNTLGTVNGNTIIFTIPEYRGEKYEFIYKAILDNNLAIGSEIVTESTWSLVNVIQQTELHDITLGEQIYDATISIYGPQYSLPNEYICYTMSVENTGNQVLNSAVFTNELPPHVDYYQLSTGTFHIGAIDQNLSADYFIEYETQSGSTGNLGPFNTDVNRVVNLLDFIPTGETLSVLRWNLQQLGVGVKSKNAPSLFGVVKSTTAINSSLLDHIHLVFEETGEQSERIQNFSTIIDDICVLRPSLSFSGGNAPVKPSDEITISTRANCVNSRLKNPIIAVLLPKELAYKGNAIASYSDVFGTVNPELPPAVVIENFTDENQTLVKFEFTGDYEYSFRQLATITVKFDVEVKVGAYGEISCFSVLNTDGSTGIIPDNVDVFFDDYGISQSPLVSQNYAKSSTNKKTILFFVSTSSNKKVKGALDAIFVEEPLVGKTYEGGKLQYLISIKNTGNADLLDAEIVDILPHIGDTGVILTNAPRKSEFAVFSISEITAKIMPENTSTGVQIYYSTSTDPVRFGANFDEIGTVDDWTTELPEDLTTLKSFKVTAKDLVLKPLQSLEISVNSIVPVGVEVEQIAWNSFAADVSYIDINKVKQKMLAVEPEKVGIEIFIPDPDSCQIGGNVWYDSNSDGYYVSDEPFMNDAGVALLNEKMEIIDAVFTAPDASGNDGQYLFSNLPKGKYYVQFFIDDKNFKFTTQRNSSQIGSKARQKDGRTELIDMTNQSSVRNISAGVIDIDTVTIDSLLKVNKSARNMVRDVVKNQMLLVMKEEDVVDLIKNS